MPLDPEHYCIQAKRIEKIDKKVDEIHNEFQMGGTVSTMSDAINRLTTLAENRKKENGVISPKMLYWIIAGLVVILAAILGVNLPL